MSAIPVCDEVRKAKMIAAVQKLLEVDVIRQGDKAILNWISSDYIFNIVPYVFNLALANPNDQQAVRICPVAVLSVVPCSPVFEVLVSLSVSRPVPSSAPMRPEYRL